MPPFFSLTPFVLIFRFLDLLSLGSALTVGDWRLLLAALGLGFEPIFLALRSLFGGSNLKKAVLMLQKEEKYMKIKPLYDRVLIRRLEGSTTSKGGIIIPDSAKEKPLEGEVIAVGSGRLLKDGSTRSLTVKEGDKVLFAKYAETEVKIDNETLLLLREEDLLGIIA